MTSRIALILALTASTIAVTWGGRIWILAIPVVFAALPLAIPRHWTRVTAAIILGFCVFGLLGAWTLYIPGLVAAVLAAYRGRRDPSASPLRKHKSA